MKISSESLPDRIARGKALEATIIKNLTPQLASIGSTIVNATLTEDKYDKIDRWIITAKGTRLSLQLKVRTESGDDLPYEIIKNMETGEDGRDLKCQANLYLYVDRNGKGWMYKTQTIKAAVLTLLAQVKKDLGENPTKKVWDGDTYQIRITIDNNHGNTKLMGFFSPTHFPAFSSFPNLYA